MDIDLESKVKEILLADPGISRGRLQMALREVGIRVGMSRIGHIYRNHRKTLGNLGGKC